MKKGKSTKLRMKDVFMLHPDAMSTFFYYKEKIWKEDRSATELRNSIIISCLERGVTRYVQTKPKN